VVVMVRKVAVIRKIFIPFVFYVRRYGILQLLPGSMFQVPLFCVPPPM